MNFTDSSFQLQVKSMRLSTMYPSAVFDRFAVDNVNQGAIGNCWLISTLAMLVSCHSLVFKNMITPCNEFNNGTCYDINLWLNGHPFRLRIDDYVPVQEHGNWPKYARVYGNNIATLLLEKAFAKIFNGYEKLTSNYFDIAVAILSNGTIRDPDLSGSFKKFNFADYCVSLATPSNLKERSGLAPHHGYSIVYNLEMKPGNHEKIELVNIHNGNLGQEFNGNWSDWSSSWKTHLRINKAKETMDHQFFMPVSKLDEYFHINVFNVKRTRVVILDFLNKFL